MNEIIYEAEPFYGIYFPFLMLCIITCFLAFFLIFFRKKTDVYGLIFYSFILIFFIYIIVCNVFVSIDAKHKVYDSYIKGNYLTVQGEICNYILADEGEPNLPDYFYVDNVEFLVPGFVSPWGYPLKRAYGGVLKEGLNVCISYIPYKFENVIMKIELI